MNTDFKPDELIFLIDKLNFIRLAKFVSIFGFKTVEAIDIDSGNEYYGFGFAATPENRQALVTLYSEDEVPKLPLSPQEVTLKLLENQKYQLCKVSKHNNKEWQFNNVLKAVVRIGTHGEFIDSNGEGWTYGIAVDNNGNEITEISDGDNTLCFK